MGESSLVVSLPKGWTNKSGVSRGDLVEVTEMTSGELFIRPKTIKEEKKAVTIDSSENIKNIKECLIHNYVNGADVLEILFGSSFNNGMVNEVYETFNKLVGFEITEASHEKIIAMSLGEAIPPGKLLNRYSSIMTNYFDSLISSFESGKENQIDKIKALRKLETEKLYYGILRNLLAAACNTRALYKMELDARDIVYYGLLADNFRDMARILERIEYFGTEYDERLSRIFKELREIFKGSMKAWRKGLKTRKPPAHTLLDVKTDSEDKKRLLALTRDLTRVMRGVSDFRRQMDERQKENRRGGVLSHGVLGVKSKSELQLEKIKKDVSKSPEEYVGVVLDTILNLIERLKKHTRILSYSF